MKETIKRTLIKAIIWRAVAFVRGTMISYAFTGNMILSLRISIAGTTVAFITYYIYERLWNNSKWGLEHE